MNKTLSQKQIGRRVAEIRKVKGLSQEELAKIIKISRPSLAQIELGNRSVDILELQKMSFVLGFSLDDFGYDADFEGDEAFLQGSDNNTFSALLGVFNHLQLGAILITLISIAILIMWDKVPALKKLKLVSRVQQKK